MGGKWQIKQQLETGYCRQASLGSQGQKIQNKYEVNNKQMTEREKLRLSCGIFGEIEINGKYLFHW